MRKGGFPLRIAGLLAYLFLIAAAPVACAEAPSREDIEQGQRFWAFQPPVPSPRPVLKNMTAPDSPLDCFILAKLEERGLRPAPPADKRKVIRRTTFSLVGLPPTAESIDAFLSDDSPDALAKVVDRLLASPAYGERWGRHWLDVARYADSNGLDENLAHGNAWRYRDYVITAINRDKPYDQFLTEQLAGDLLPAPENELVRRERLIATGFLSLGPKVLAEVDERKMEMDIIDEQIDTIGQAIIGLTLGCARCHDHKFDPISTQDYYGLAGILKSTKTMDSFKKVASWHEHFIGSPDELDRKAAHEEKIAQHKSTIDQFIEQENQKLKESSGSDEELPENAESLYPEDRRTELKRLRDELEQLEKDMPPLTTAMGVTEGEVGDTSVHVRGSHLTLGRSVPRRFPLVLAGHERDQEPQQVNFPTDSSGRLRLARWIVGDNHPLTARVHVNRIWRWHFGRGLVATPDNFGRLGERPTHPQLLDWLALRFIESGWSQKWMHRELLLSGTYQQSTAMDSRCHEIDPENRLWWRMNVRRLEAEAIRDALLAVSHTLDRRMGGSLIQVKNREFFFDHTSKDETTYDYACRSIYLPVVRNHLYEVFQLFDYSDASVVNGDRASSTVAPQALFWMNSDLVATTADRLAADLIELKVAANEPRIHRLYVRAYGRPPTRTEVDRAVRFLKQMERSIDEAEATEKMDVSRRRMAWSSLCQVILAANEFSYLD